MLTRERERQNVIKNERETKKHTLLIIERQREEKDTEYL